MKQKVEKSEEKRKQRQKDPKLTSEATYIEHKKKFLAILFSFCCFFSVITYKVNTQNQQLHAELPQS